MTLRDYQKSIVIQAKAILQKYGMVYLAMEVRTGKTFCALFACEGATKVLFVTKKKAIPSIRSDYEKSGMTYDFTIVNYESLHKVCPEDWSVIIVDEAHSIGAFPKPSNRAKGLKLIAEKSDCPIIFLSGTPTPESYSQIYHQFYISKNSPFSSNKNFYSFAKQFVDVKEKKIAYGRVIRDYSNAKTIEVKDAIRKYMIHYSQSDAGFNSVIEEEILYVDMKPSTYALCDRLANDLVIEGASHVLLADTPVKLQSKLHQLYSGTIKFEDGTRRVLDLSKAEYIRDKFVGKKIAIFYKFTAEYIALKEVYGDLLTDDIATFDSRSDVNIAMQIQSGREGTKLSNAEYLIFYNIDFSATSYWQGRDRMTTMDRKFNKVYWIFSRDGIEDKIYKAVVQKKSYTSYYFKRDYGLNNDRFQQIKLKL